MSEEMQEVETVDNGYDPNSIVDEITPVGVSSNNLNYQEPESHIKSKSSEDQEDDTELEAEPEGKSKTPSKEPVEELSQLKREIEIQAKNARKHQSHLDKVLSINDKLTKHIQQLEERLESIESRDEESFMENLRDNDVLDVASVKKMLELEKKKAIRAARPKLEIEQEPTQQLTPEQQQYQRELEVAHNHPAAQAVSEYLRTHDITKDPDIMAIPPHNVMERFHEIRLKIAKESARVAKPNARKGLPPTGGNSNHPNMGQKRAPNGKTILDARDLPHNTARSRLQNLLA